MKQSVSFAALPETQSQEPAALIKIRGAYSTFKGSHGKGVNENRQFIQEFGTEGMGRFKISSSNPALESV